ncbi:AlbA family DNA-binding domain-containing protein [Desulforhopalus sp. 52FAK]
MTKIRRLLPFVFPLLGFVLIIIAINGYQYFKLKREVSEGLIKGIGEAELSDLKQFFTETEDMLLLLRDWGQNDVLLGKGVEPLNKKLIPLLSRQPMISAISIAGDSGGEYLLYHTDDHFVSRYSMVDEGQDSQNYREWDRDTVEIRSWEEKKPYDPRKTDWYQNAGSGERVYWTEVYKLPVIGKPGLTGSIAWEKEGDGARHIVSALHVSFSRIEKILSARREERPGQLFLVRPDKSFLVLSATDTLKDTPSVTLEAIEKVIAKWDEKGQPIKDMVRLHRDTENWVASFYDVGRDENLFWVGVVAKDKELVGWLDRSLISVDIVEFLAAISGGVIILLFMRRHGMIRLGKARKTRLIRLMEYIERGEGAGVEFKSTIRMNLKSGKVGKEIEFAWLKAVVAFLNSDGGSLVLGVNDRGEICGVDADGFENNDRCLLHVKNLFNQYVGVEFSSCINISPVELSEGTVVMIECQKAPDPVFLKIGKNEEFYIRSGPSSVKLSPSQIVNFVQKSA